MGVNGTTTIVPSNGYAADKAISIIFCIWPISLIQNLLANGLSSWPMTDLALIAMPAGRLEEMYSMYYADISNITSTICSIYNIACLYRYLLFIISKSLYLSDLFSFQI